MSRLFRRRWDVLRMPFLNRSSNEVQLIVEPEGHTFSVPPGATFVVVLKVRTAAPPEIEVVVEDELISLAAMCTKEVWCGTECLMR